MKVKEGECSSLSTRLLLFAYHPHYTHSTTIVFAILLLTLILSLSVFSYVTSFLVLIRTSVTNTIIKKSSLPLSALLMVINDNYHGNHYHFFNRFPLLPSLTICHIISTVIYLLFNILQYFH